MEKKGFSCRCQEQLNTTGECWRIRALRTCLARAAGPPPQTCCWERRCQTCTTASSHPVPCWNSTPRESFLKTECLFNHQNLALISFQFKSKASLGTDSGALDGGLKKSTFLGAPPVGNFEHSSTGTAEGQTLRAVFTMTNILT